MERRELLKVFISITVLIAISMLFLFSCGAGVDIGEANKVLTSFKLEWPGEFEGTCKSSEPLSVVISALDQNGQVYSWDGTVYIEPENLNVYVSPGSVNVNNGSVTRPIAFINDTDSDVITNVNLSYETILVNVGSNITVCEVLAPADVNNFTATAWDEQIKLEWTNPLDSDFAGVKLLMKEDGYPFNVLDGEVVYDGSGTEYIDENLTNDNTHYYSIFSYDSNDNYSGGMSTDSMPEKHSVQATHLPGDHEVNLFWAADIDADSYNIYYTDDDTEPGIENGIKIEVGTSNTKTIEGLVNFTIHKFVVSAVKEGMESLSDVMSSVPPGDIIDAGGFHTISLKAGGTVWTWGHNVNGQLGDGNGGSGSWVDTPVQVVGEGGVGTLTGVVAVSAGSLHSVALKADGTVWAWGDNWYGQLGNGSGGSGQWIDTPVQVVGEGGAGTLTDVIEIAAGMYHTVVLKKDGTVWAWGRGMCLGNGTGSESYTPQQVVGEWGEGVLTGVVSISSSSGHTLALKSDGTVVAWGYNSEGQLGDGTEALSYEPVSVKGEGGIEYLSGVVTIAAGGYHSLALMDNGTLFSWGSNVNGQLGDNNYGFNSEYPVQVTGEGGTGTISNVTMVNAGMQQSLALKDDGTAWAWGDNEYGQLGDENTGVDSDTPLQVAGEDGVGNLIGVVSMASGGHHSMSLNDNGTIWTWGDNNMGQLGDANLDIDSDTPVQVSGPGSTGVQKGFLRLSAGMYHSASVKGNKTVWTWGDNAYGQLGDGSDYVDSNTPVQVVGKDGVGYLENVTDVAAGYNHTLALKDGNVWAWGDNDHSQLGDPLAGDMNTPVQVVGEGGEGFLSNVSAIAAGGYHSVALIGGAVWTWGNNSHGQLGTGSTGGTSATPVQVVGVGGSDYLTNIVAVSAGNNHTVALNNDGDVFAWGRNVEGQLGNDSTVNSDTPVQVVGVGGSGYLTNIVAVSAGDNYTVAINTDGYVFGWGYNGYGQLGDGNIMTNSDIPVYINGEYGTGYLTDVIAIATGDSHTVALKNDGTLCACGNGTSGQLGDGWFGISRDWMRPVLGEGGNGTLTGVDAVAAGSGHTIALKSDGILRAWGKNDNGQLGNGNSGIDQNTPVFVTVFYTGWY